MEMRRNRMARKLFLSLAGLLFSLVLKAQVESSLFKNYSVAEGMDDKTIHCIFQDSRGWIWIGSDFGVIRFDGYEFHRLTLNTPVSDILNTSLIRVIQEDSHGRIWIGAETNGLFIYERERYTLHHIVDTILPDNSIWDIDEDRAGNRWIATENGLLRWNYESGDTEIFKNLKSDPGSLINNFVRSVLIDSQDRLWVGTNNGICMSWPEQKRFRSFLTRSDFESRKSEVWDIYEDHAGRVWVGTYLGGLYKFLPEKEDFLHIPLDEENTRAQTVRSIHQSPDLDYWIGTRGGLYQTDSTFSRLIRHSHDIFHENSLAHNSVLDLFVDRKGDLWVGTRNGISYLNFGKRAFAHLSSRFNQDLRLPSNEVYTFWEAPDNKIWIGTENGGVIILDRNTESITSLTTADGLSSNCIKAICPDGRGNILIGTYLGGLNRYNPKTGRITIYVNDPDDTASVSDNAIWTIFSDSKKRIWIGTSEGIDLFDPDRETFTNYSERFGAELIVSIFEDRFGTLWMYSEQLKSLVNIDHHFNAERMDVKARAVCDDAWNNLWFGTLGHGLLRYNIFTDSVTYYTTEDGLCSNVIYGILNDNNRFIWLSTNNGISRFDIKNEEFRNYSTGDGLLNLQFNYGAFLQAEDGTLIFGGKKGVDFIYPDKLLENDYVPPVVLTDFRIFNEQVPVLPEDDESMILSNLISETDHITVRYNQNMLSFKFAALNYANSEKNQYRYKLEGFDKNWNDIGNNRVATYTNLDPGEYVLKVTGTNSDNKFAAEGVELEIEVLPPFWKTFAFRMLVVLVMLGIGYLVYLIMANRQKLANQLHFERHAARQVKELDMLKHQFFMNISHEIRTPLSLILGPLDNMLQNDLSHIDVKSNLKIIRKNTENLRKLVNQLLDYRKLETGNVWLELKKGNFSAFVDEIIKSFKSLAKDKNIQLEFNTTQKDIFTWFDGDKVEKMVNNLLSNAIKYTDNGGRIYISLSMIFIDDIMDTSGYVPSLDPEAVEQKQYIQLAVRDTGIGIPSGQLSHIFNRFKQIVSSDRSKGGVGIGLSLTKELVKIHEGFIKATSVEGKGSKFTLLLPFNEKGPDEEHDARPGELSDENSSAHTIDHMLDEVKAEKIGHYKPIILVVDDNPDIREFIRLNFEPEYFVVDANNGREGWEKALETIPDLIIADYMMPLMDGIELCRKIKRDERTSHIPVMMLTVLSASEKQREGIDAGAEDYITKPFDISLLRSKVGNILSIRKALREKYSKEVVLMPKEVVLSSPDEKFLRKVIQIIEKNISNTDLDIDFLAKHVGVSRTQLYRKIKALTDMAAKEFVKDMRLKRASQLLTQGKLNISEIAYEVGFSDMSYFRKCFKEAFGVSPTDYAKQHQEAER